MKEENKDADEEGKKNKMKWSKGEKKEIKAKSKGDEVKILGRNEFQFFFLNCCPVERICSMRKDD